MHDGRARGSAAAGAAAWVTGAGVVAGAGACRGAGAGRAWSAKVEARGSGLAEVEDFGSNPGGLRMLNYVPKDLPESAPLVVVLHGCTQTAGAYDFGTGWSTLADRHGFAMLYPEQRRTNNPLRCFNWFRSEDLSLIHI